MKKSELCVVAFMLVFSAYFAYETLQLPDKAQHYPLFVIGLLIFLTILKLIAMYLASGKDKKIVNDSDMVWLDFQKKQFFTVFIASILFFAIMHFIGFYLASLVYLIYCLRYFRISLKHSAITIIAMLVVVYAVFSGFLNVPLPAGELLQDLI